MTGAGLAELARGELEATSSAPTLMTASPVATSIHLGVIVSITVMVALLFLFVYVQLAMVLCLGYKLFSYQTVLLFVILLWASLRLTLYSTYYFHCCDLDEHLSAFPEWLLVSFPSALQFFSLAIIVHYYGQSLYGVLQRRQEMSSLAPPYRKMKQYKFIGWFMWLSALSAFFAGGVTFSVLIHYQETNPNKSTYQLLTILRVVFLEGLFLIMGITLVVCIILIYTTRVGKDVLETTRGYRATPFFTAISLLAVFVTRAIYNAVALGVSELMPYGWTVATDMGDYEFSHHYGYIIYLVGQLLWEVLPTFIIVVFFRIKTSRNVLIMKQGTMSPKSSKQKHFFDDPRHYDSDHEEPILGTFNRSSKVSIPSLPSSRSHASPSFTSYGYGSMSRHNSSAPSKYSINSTPRAVYIQPGTTPPKLFTQSPTFR